jgi:hypothetical protein
MREESAVDFSDWPEAPSEDRPKPLFVTQKLTVSEALHLSDLGWTVIDVRTLPNKTESDRQYGVKCKLEGARQGSILLNRLELDTLELEARTSKLLNNKETANNSGVKISLTKDDLEVIANFQSKRAFQGAFGGYDDFVARVEAHVVKQRKSKF